MDRAELKERLIERLADMLEYEDPLATAEERAEQVAGEVLDILSEDDEPDDLTEFFQEYSPEDMAEPRA